MLGFRQRDNTAHAQAADSSVYADLAGAVVNGPVAIGEHIVQIHADHGAVVNYLAPKERPRPRPRGAPLRRLPRDVPELLGRERVLSELRNHLAPGAAPVELTGPAGIGKSALLRHLSHRVEQDSVIFTACRRQPADDLLQFLFESLYECEQPFVPSPAQLAEYLQEPAAVLLLDDVEYERDELERIICLAPACSFVYASEARRLFGEGRSLALEPLEGQAGAALFERHLEVELDGEERRAIEAFCRRVGEPLRILQAADLVRRGDLTLAGLSEFSLDTELDDSLSEPERRVLEPLRALPAAPLNAEQVSALTGVSEARRTLGSLEERRLVQSCSPRYLPRPSAAAAPEPETWAARTMSELAAWCERQGEPERIADSSEAVIAALDAGAAPAEALRLVRSAEPALMYTRRWGAWHSVLKHGLAAARQLQDRAGEAWALHQLGSRALPRGEREAANDALTAALTIRYELGDTAGAAITRHNLDLLHGGAPPSSSNGRPTGPRRPPLLALLGVAAVAAVIGTAGLASGDQEPESPRAPAAAPASRPSQANSPTPAAGTRSPRGRARSANRSARPGAAKAGGSAAACPEVSGQAQEAAGDQRVDGCREPGTVPERKSETPSKSGPETPSTPRGEPPYTPNSETPYTPNSETPYTPNSEAPSTPNTETPSTPCCEPRATPGGETPSTPGGETPSTPTAPPRKCLVLDERC